MAQRSSMRPPKGGNIKKGICQNHQYVNPDTGETGDCPKCASGEIQSVNVQRLSDFKCSVCGAKLLPVKEGPFEKIKKFILPVIGVIVVIVAIIIGMKQCDGKDDVKEPVVEETVTTQQDGTETEGQTVVDDGQQADDTTAAEPETDMITKPGNGGEKPDSKTVDSATPAAGKTVLNGAAKLVNNKGFTDIVFLRDYTLDLGKADGRTLKIRKDEKIERADIRHNVLRGGTYINSSEEENDLKGLNVKL